MKKNKNKLITIIIILVIIAVAGIGITVIVKNKNNGNIFGSDSQTQQDGKVETVYGNFKVDEVKTQYYEDNDETSVEMTINNNTEETIERATYNTVLLGENGETLSTIEGTELEEMPAGSQQNITIVCQGDLTNVKDIKLEKVEE